MNLYFWRVMELGEFNRYRYFICLAYDGSSYHGWQRQPGSVSVQQVVEEAFAMLLRCKVPLTGAGRTDTGVHAREFYAHFDLTQPLTRSEREQLVFRLNALLSSSIAVYDIFPVQTNAHARFSATSRTYQYFINLRKDPFFNHYSWYVYGAIDMDIMNRGASLLMDYTDFTSFSKVDTDTHTNECRLMHCSWKEEGGKLVFTITANRFLRNMVRAVTGTLVDLGRGRITFNELIHIVESKNRCNAGESAPARGLFLTGILYPDTIKVE